MLLVKWSYDKDITKGGHEDEVPIADALLPYLETAIARSPGYLVFPGRDGNMRTEEADPQIVLRRALGRAGLVEGYEHVCRRCKAKGRPDHTIRHADPGVRRCQTCGMKLWPRALPRPLRFHDLRHSTATILLAKGTPPHIVQRILRHASVATTTAIYGHLQAEDVRAAVNSIAPPSKTSRRVTSAPDPEREKAGLPAFARDSRP